jgi:hypothetical protein
MIPWCGTGKAFMNPSGFHLFSLQIYFESCGSCLPKLARGLFASLMIPWSGTGKAFMNPSGFHLFPLQPLMKASFQRDFGKINDPAGGGVHEGFAERGGFEPPVPF